MNSPWQRGQDLPQPSAEPVLVTDEPIIRTMNIPMVARTARRRTAVSIGVLSPESWVLGAES
jgi:hypothetical protein